MFKEKLIAHRKNLFFHFCSSMIISDICFESLKKSSNDKNVFYIYARSSAFLVFLEDQLAIVDEAIANYSDEISQHFFFNQQFYNVILQYFLKTEIIGQIEEPLEKLIIPEFLSDLKDTQMIHEQIFLCNKDTQFYLLEKIKKNPKDVSLLLLMKYCNSLGLHRNLMLFIDYMNELEEFDKKNRKFVEPPLMYHYIKLIRCFTHINESIAFLDV